MGKDGSGKGWMKDLASKAGEAAKTVSQKTVGGTKVAGSHVSWAGGAAVEKTAQGSRAAASQIARAGSATAEQASRAAALAASNAMRGVFAWSDPVLDYLVEVDPLGIAEP